MVGEDDPKLGCLCRLGNKMEEYKLSGISGHPTIRVASPESVLRINYDASRLQTRSRFHKIPDFTSKSMRRFIHNSGCLRPIFMQWTVALETSSIEVDLEQVHFRPELFN